MGIDPLNKAISEPNERPTRSCPGVGKLASMCAGGGRGCLLPPLPLLQTEVKKGKEEEELEEDKAFDEIPAPRQIRPLSVA